MKYIVALLLVAVISGCAGSHFENGYNSSPIAIRKTKQPKERLTKEEKRYMEYIRQ